MQPTRASSRVVNAKIDASTRPSSEQVLYSRLGLDPEDTFVVTAGFDSVKFGDSSNQSADAPDSNGVVDVVDTTLCLQREN